MSRFLIASMLAVVLGACASAPLPAPREWTLEDGFHATGGHTLDGPVDTVAFWRGFNDPLLADLVEDVLRDNHDIRVALARYDQARALHRQSRRDRTPTLTAGATAAHERLGAVDAPGIQREARDRERYQAHVEAGWELDFFGRVRHGVNASRAEAEASAADVAAMRIAVVGELGQAYFQLRGLQAQRQVALNNARNQLASLQLVEEWEAAGRSSRLDTSRARAQLELTRSRVPALDAGIATAVHRIGVLSGRPPGELRERLLAPMPVPDLPETIAVGAPGDLLRRRPDILAAEQRLVSATARVGIATADLFPRFTLGGLIGTRAGSGGDLFSRDAESRLIALGIDWSFLDIGRVRARIAAAEADAAGHLARYEQTVLLALEESEGALARYHRAHDEHRHLERSAGAALEAAELARLRFEYGAVGFLDVLDAERAALDSDDRLAQSGARLGIELVAVYRALAGGWPERLGPDLSQSAATPRAACAREAPGGCRH